MNGFSQDIVPITVKELYMLSVMVRETENEEEKQELESKYAEIEARFMRQYADKINAADDNMAGYYQKVRDARDAFRQVIPDSMKKQTTERDKGTGNSQTNATASAILHPAFTITAKKTIESFSALPFRFDIAANDALGVQQKKVIDRKLKSIYTRQNVTSEMFLGYFFNVINGLSISQTKTFKKARRIVKPEIDPETNTFKEESLNEDRVISIICYDPLTSLLDCSAKTGDITETSEFAVITDRYITARDSEEYYAFQSSKMMDIHKRALYADHGIEYDKFVPVREYYDRSGYYAVIVGDSKIIEISRVSNGTVGRIPLNIAPIWTDPDSPTRSTTLWEHMRRMVALASRGLNLICDNVALNNNSPFFALTGSGLEDNATLDEFEPREIVQLSPTGKSGDIRGQITRFTFQEVTAGTQTMMEQGQTLAFMLAGTSPINFGIQDKQIRVSGAADMISSATVRPDSDVARKMEVGFMNPTTWDIVQIFYLYYDDFGFNEDELPKEFLKELKHIRVVPGSYLPEDAMTRLQRAAAIVNRATTNPEAYKQVDVEEEFLDALGVVMPEQFIKTGQDILRQQTAFFAFQQFIAQAVQQLGAGVLQNPQVEQILGYFGRNVDGSYNKQK